MANTILLDSRLHKEVRVKTERSHALGDNVMWAPTFAPEFRNVQAYYPILFQEDPASHQLFPVALFGFEQAENLFLGESGWNASYIPLMIQRLPFSIGLYPNGDTDGDKKRLINIDLDHPRVSSTTDGERLFGEHGEESPYLERIAGMLEAIHVWNEHNKEFMAALTDYDLIEPVTLDIHPSDGPKGQLVGFHTINEERLTGLSIEELGSLHKKDFLSPIYMAVASLSNIRKLVEMKSVNDLPGDTLGKP